MDQLITQSKPTFELGTIVAQVAQFSGSKTIDKASLNLTLTNSKIQTMVIGVGGVVSFSAAAFQSGRDTWTFQPVIHWDPAKDWTTRGTTIENTLQTISYLSSVDASMNAPFITHKLFVESGTYDLWGLGYTSAEGVYWSFNDDTSDMRKMVLGTPGGPPQWTKFGSFLFEKEGKNTFSIYLSDATTVVLDQWYFTQDPDFDQTISSEGLDFLPLDVSKGPFNTAVRIRSLSPYGTLDDLVSPTPGSSVVAQWLSSEVITASGEYHYGVQNDIGGTGVIYTDGLSIEFWQIGGRSSSEFFPSWDFIFPTTSVGTAWISTDFGENFTEL